MKQVVITVSLIFLTCCAIVSLAGTNTINQPLLSTASNQPHAITTDHPIDVNLYEFNYTLDFAREMGFRRIVELLEEENYPAALQALEEKTRAGFSCRTEATNGYQYGFFAEALKGICLEKMGEGVNAYRSYQNARHYILNSEEDKSVNQNLPIIHELYNSIARFYDTAGRLYDAENWYYYVYATSPSNLTPYIVSLKGLLQVNMESGNYTMAEKYSNELLKKPDMLDAATMAHCIDLLFNRGNYEQGVIQLLDGIRKHGLQYTAMENNDCLQRVRKYWFHFHEFDIVDYYDLIDSCIKDNEFKGREQFVAMLINTRSMIKTLYPELIVYNENDVSNIAARIAQRSNSIYRCIDSQAYTERAPHKKKSEQVRNAYSYSYTNMLIEMMLDTIHTDNLESGRMYDMYTNILHSFTKTQLTNVYYDGANALFIVYAGIGDALYRQMIYKPSEKRLQARARVPERFRIKDEHTDNTLVYTNKVHEADTWYALAEDNAGAINNMNRFGAILIRRAHIYQLLNNDDTCDEYLQWAKELCGEYPALKQKITALYCMQPEYDVSIETINELLLENNGYIIRELYNYLAVLYARAGAYDMVMKTICDGIMYTPLEYGNDILLNIAEANQSIFSYAELHTLQAIIEKSVMRVPATTKDAYKIRILQQRARSTWLTEQLRLSEIENGGRFTDEQMQMLKHHSIPAKRNKTASPPTVRGCRLFMNGQRCNRDSEEDKLDWAGWQSWRNAIAREMRYAGVPWIIDTRQQRNKWYDELIEFYRTNYSSVPANQVDMVETTLISVAPSAPEELTSKIMETAKYTHNTNVLFDLYYYEISKQKDPARVENVLSLMPAVDTSRRTKLEELVKWRAAGDSQTNAWNEMLIRLQKVTNHE